MSDIRDEDDDDEYDNNVNEYERRRENLIFDIDLLTPLAASC